MRGYVGSLPLVGKWIKNPDKFLEDAVICASSGSPSLASTYLSSSFNLLREEVKRHMPMLGSKVCIAFKDGGSTCGIAEGISEDGALMLRVRDGLRSISDYGEVQVLDRASKGDLELENGR